MTRGEADQRFVAAQMERHKQSVMKVLNWNIAYTTDNIDGDMVEAFPRRPRGETFHGMMESPSEFSCLECTASFTSASQLHFCFTCMDSLAEEPEFCVICLKKSHRGHSHCLLTSAPKELRRRMAAEFTSNLKMVDNLVLSKLIAKFKTHMARYREEFRSQITQMSEDDVCLNTSDVQTELKQLKAVRSQTEDEMRKLRDACREFDKFINSKFPCE
ncbi:hypothetical protein QR680_017192 [Steinernema hermaphroditum]|uniref:Uncharacterized protein n=1 Tax=Steinernema hermaphroditum TaxID=289476 RepID=A0AA39HEU2_9BILA|nr:hypothetical protein QR680_017192 [Steinernema hermaphroditum]